jgi:alpha-N-acetylglucosamine transferase
MDEYEHINNMRFDIVIKLRPDALSVQNLDFMQYSYTDDIVYTPNIATFYFNGMNDQMAIGTSNVMKRYMSLYTRIIPYLNGRVINPLRPETLMRYHLTNNSIRIIAIPWTYYVLRCAGGFLFPKGPNMDYSKDQRMIASYL